MANRAGGLCVGQTNGVANVGRSPKRGKGDGAGGDLYAGRSPKPGVRTFGTNPLLYAPRSPKSGMKLEGQTDPPQGLQATPRNGWNTCPISSAYGARRSGKSVSYIMLNDGDMGMALNGYAAGYQGPVLKFRMRAWDNTLGMYVFWSSDTIDAPGSDYVGPGPLIRVVIFKLVGVPRG
jgi:hypothetical protein